MSYPSYEKENETEISEVIFAQKQIKIESGTYVTTEGKCFVNKQNAIQSQILINKRNGIVSEKRLAKTFSSSEIPTENQNTTVLKLEEQKDFDTWLVNEGKQKLLNTSILELLKICWSNGAYKQTQRNYEKLKKYQDKIEELEKDVGFYRCCALSGEVPKEGSEPSARQNKNEK